MYVLCGTRFGGSQDVVQEREGLEGSFQGGHEDGGRWESDAARFQGFGGCSVEEAPAASEYTKMGGCVGLRLSRVTWSYVLAESPFSILHSPSGLPTGIGHRGFTRSEGQTQIQEANLLLHKILYTRHSHVWPRLIFAQDFPGHNDRYRSSPGPTIKAKQGSRGHPFLAAWDPVMSRSVGHFGR